MAFDARGRDLLTPADATSPKVLACDLVRASVAPDRTLLALEATPSRGQALTRLVGCKGGGHLRAALAQALPEERRNATPLHLLIDDFSGASLIAHWAWSRWVPDWLVWPGDRRTQSEVRALRAQSMEGVCVGFGAGASSLKDIHGDQQRSYPAMPLQRADDPIAWHDMPASQGVAMRRARRLDLWIDPHRPETIQVDAMFQDSASQPDGGRAAIHFYTLHASLDRNRGALQSLVATPYTLPYPECPSATDNLQVLLGEPVATLRERVLELLAKDRSCTHLNDALRALAEVPALAQHLAH